MARKTKLKVLNEILKENLQKGKNIKFFTKGFYGDLLEVREYIGYVNNILKTEDNKKYRLELVFDNNQIVNTVAFKEKNIKIGDFVKLIGFFYEGFERMNFYCKGINKIIANEKELEEFNEIKCYEMSLPINLSKIELASVYRESENFIKIDGINDFYYIGTDELEDEIDLTD